MIYRAVSGQLQPHYKTPECNILAFVMLSYMPPFVLDVNIMDEMSVKIQNYSETASGNMLIFYNKVKEELRNYITM